MTLNWVKTVDELPTPETEVIVKYKGHYLVLELAWDHPNYEDNYKSFRYWTDADDTTIIECIEDVKEWAYIEPPTKKES